MGEGRRVILPDLRKCSSQHSKEDTGTIGMIPLCLPLKRNGGGIGKPVMHCRHSSVLSSGDEVGCCVLKNDCLGGGSEKPVQLDMQMCLCQDLF